MNITVDLNETGIPAGVIQIVERLPTFGDDSDTKESSVTLRFHDNFVYQTGLVLLSTWCKSLPNNVKVLVDDHLCKETTKRLLTNSGFREIVEKGAEGPAVLELYAGKVSIQPIVQSYATQAAITEICNILDSSINGTEGTEPLRTLLSEICENAYAHAEFQTPGYLCANVNQTNNTCEIAIADSGIGILNSYLEGTNEVIKGRIDNGASAIELAIDGLVPSKPTPVPGTWTHHFGYGLFIVRRLIEENRGRLTIISGNECVTIDRYQKRRTQIRGDWKGTFVGLLIQLENPLPLAEIYAEAIDSVVPDGIIPGEAETETAIELQPPIQSEIVEFALAQFGSQLLSRDQGIAIRADVATILARNVKVKAILDEIEDITPSVADECFGKLAESLGREVFNNKVIFVGGSQLMQRLVKLVVENRLAKSL